MDKIFVVGSFVCDLVATMERFPAAGESVIGTTFNTFLGGKGANQLVSIHRLNGNVFINGKVGKDAYGDNFIKVLKEEGIDVSGVLRSDKSTGVGCVQINASGQNRICIILGANLDFELKDINLNILKECKYFLTQFEMRREISEGSIRIAKENGLITVVNPAPAREISENIYKMIDFITPNETELAYLSGVDTSTIDGVIEGASVLLKRGVKNIIVTLGERGALLLNKDECALVSAYNVNPIDTVAAGDSFNGAFITSLSKGKSIIESIKFANAMGALTTLKKGAIPSLHNEKEVEEFINSNEELKVIKMR